MFSVLRPDLLLLQISARGCRVALASRYDRSLRVSAGVMRERDHFGCGRRGHSELVRVRLASKRRNQIARAKENGTTHDRRPITVAGTVDVV